MARMTLLEMVQDIMSAMESDEVNSISDTVESLQVAQEIRTTYDELFSSTWDLPSQEGLITLEPLSDPSRPNVLKLPDNVKEIKWLRYDFFTNGETDYQDVHFLPPEDFLQRQTIFAEQEPRILVDKLYCYNDRNPRFWTTFDNEHLIFDAYNSTVDSAMQESKSLAWGTTFKKFELSDNFIPDIDTSMFPLLLAEAKKSCFVNFKQISNANEERRARRQMVRLQKDLWRANQRKPYNRYPDYSRPRR